MASLLLNYSSMKKGFNYLLNYKKINIKKRPELYRVGIGEQGVLLVEPYKSEILPYWRFKNPEVAKKSANEILKLFNEYLKNEDFIGMDMTRKFLQMGYTRSRRYANHKSGKKYDGPVPSLFKGVSGSHGREMLPLDVDEKKALSARIFYKAWMRVEKNEIYQILKQSWKICYG